MHELMKLYCSIACLFFALPPPMQTCKFRHSNHILFFIYTFARIVRLKLMNTYIAIILVLIAGTKLMYIFHNTVVEVLEKINEVHNNTRFKVCTCILSTRSTQYIIYIYIYIYIIRGKIHSSPFFFFLKSYAATSVPTPIRMEKLLMMTSSHCKTPK